MINTKVNVIFKINVNTAWNIKMVIVLVNQKYVMISDLHQKYQKKK